MSWGDDLMSGFQVGNQMASNVMRQIQQVKLMKRQEDQDALQMALLQKDNPGLHVAEHTTVDGQDALKALPVEPGTENDKVQAFGNGVTFNQGEADREKKKIIRDKIEAQIQEGRALMPLERERAEIAAEIADRKAYNLSPDEVRMRYDPILKRDVEVGRGAPKGIIEKPLEFKDMGDSIVGFDPVNGKEKIRHPKTKGREVKTTPQGLYEYDPADPSNGKIISGTAPVSISSKLSDPDKKFVDTLATKNANRISVANQLETSLKILEDPNVSETDKVREGESLLKTINSPEGSDAIGAEEAKRIGTLITFQKGNYQGIVDPTQKFWGRDLQGFASQIRTKAKSLRDSAKAGEREISEKMGTGSNDDSKNPLGLDLEL